MKLHSDMSETGHTCESVPHAAPDTNPNHRLTLTSCALNPGCLEAARLCNGSCDQSEPENCTSLCDKSEADPDGITVTSEDDSTVDEEDGLTPEVQRAYRIFQSFLSEKHKSVTAPFWQPNGPGSQAPGTHMSFRTIDDKFVNREYVSITAFVADFRLMLENCYRFHGVNHWISKQAQKLEIILEQKLTLLPRTLREKTTLAVTSRGRFGTEDEKAPVGSSSRRRSVPRNLATITVGGSESIMVQALRLEELQRAKEEKRQRELERKEAEEASVKELEEWEAALLSLAEPWPVRTMWELPAIGHFLCLAQTALNLPEIVFYELERCLLMPRCSLFLAKVMTSLLCHPHKRANVHRRPPLPYRKWEVELRCRVQGWYRAVGRAEDQTARAEQLGLCHQFFWTLGDASPLEETPFHLLPFNQRVWLLKGLCDHVYETQKDVQDAVLGQPIHECRESILGYDGQENAYIHFPHFCGADLRIYCQSPCGAMEFPLPLFHVNRSEEEPEGSEVKEETFMPAFEEEVCVSVDDVKVEDENPVRTELNAWDVKEDSLADVEDLDQKCSSGVLSWCKEDSLDSGSIRGKFMDEGRLKEEDEDEPCFRVGDNCYKGISPALNTHKGPKTDADLKSGGDQSSCPECSGASQESPRLCSRCRLWTEPIWPGITHPRQDDSTGTRQKRKRKERRFGMRKTRTAKLSLKSRAAKSSLQRAASSIKKKDRRRKLGKQFDGKAMMLARREPGPALPPAEPTFQLVCSSLDDLRVLISKTEDQLDDLDGGKKRSGRWPHKRATVKELHITLIRLLNELLPWEPKLVKAFQRNRARLKKECDDFKKHPDYKNFIREQMDTTETGEGSLSTETTRELADGEGKMSRTMKDDSETKENVNQLGNHVLRCVVDGPETVMHASESGPFTRSSKRRQSGAICDDMSPCKRGKMEPESSSEHDFEVASREQATVLPEPMSSIQGTCKPIQALLAKSVGNKVTLISHPKAAVMAQILRDHKTAPVTVPVQLSTTCSPHSEPITTETIASTTTSTTESTGPVVYKTAGGVGLLRKGSTSVKFSVQPLSEQKSGEKVMQQVVILPSNLLIQSTENKASQTSVSVSKNATTLSNALGFTIPENKVPVQQVAPLKDTSTVRTPSAVVTPSLRTLTTLGVPKKTTEPKVAGTSGLTKPDAKEELRTVCIRDSQSILVTTRGGNTGVVKVQTSESGMGALPPSPVFTISPQLQAFLVSKSSTSTTQAVSASLAANSVPGVTPQSLSKEVVPFGSSTFMAGADTPLTLNEICFDAKTSIPGKSALLASSKSSESVLVPAKDVQGIQNTVPKCGMKPPQKRTLQGSRTSDRPALQKVFLVAPSQNICSAASKVTTTTAACAMQASRVMFIRNPALTIPKDVSTSEVSISSTSTPALKVIPKLGTTLSCPSSGMSIQSIGVPGLSSRILGADNKPEASGKSTPVIISRVSPTSASSGLQVSPKSSLVASRSPTGNTENSLKVPGTVDGKMLTFSSLGTGHMASSALLSLVKPDVPSSVSTLNALHCNPGLTTGSSSLSISCSYTGGLITKHTTLPIDMTANKTGITSLCTSASPIITTVNACATRVSNSVSSYASTPPLVMTSGIRPPAKSVQEKIVINTSTPLAPGTQLLINNTRFVVPSQGLGPGSHVLLINSCPGGSQGPGPVRPGGSQGPSPCSAVPRGPNSLASQIVPSVVQGMRLVTPVRLPSPKIGPSEAHQQLGSRTPLNVSSPTAVSQVAQALRPGVSSDIVRLPIFQSSDVSVPPTLGITRSPKETSFSQGGLPSTTSPMLLQGRPSQNQAMLVVPPMKPAIARNSPMVTAPPMSSTISRIQKLPVATVPPIGGPTSTSSATPIATVPPSVNTVIMTPCTTIRAVQPGMIGKPVILPQLPQRENTFPVQVPTSSKLLLSPDGAVLNIVQAANVQVLAKPMAAQVVSSSSSSVIVSDDPLRESDPLGRPNH